MVNSKKKEKKIGIFFNQKIKNNIQFLFIVQESEWEKVVKMNDSDALKLREKW
jgi:hypothetical protein